MSPRKKLDESVDGSVDGSLEGRRFPPSASDQQFDELAGRMRRTASERAVPRVAEWMLLWR